MDRKAFFFGAVFVPAIWLLVAGHSAYAIEAHKNIKGLFNTTRDVVIKCLECHQQKAAEILEGTHWIWQRSRIVNGSKLLYGKRDSLAGFAVDVTSNPTRCLRCHISTAPDPGIFEQGTEADVDCLVCHDTTGKYTRNGGLVKPDQTDYEIIARNVGKPSPANCTTCHFADCGLMEYSRPDAGENRKKHPSGGDIHMSGSTALFSCQSCHVENSGHSFTRTGINGPGMSVPGAGCSSCHPGSPHQIDILNSHTATVSCQTCHIPAYAVETPALVGWNWFLTGKILPVFQTLSYGRTLLQDSNGFTSSIMIEPVYMWDNGSDLVYTRGQRIQPHELTYLQKPAERSPESKIAPFRILYGTQLYDAKYRYLISPLLSTAGNELFPGLDWNAISREGMKAIVLPYSGEYGIALTARLRRINHGVVSSREALDCSDCHGSDGRLDWKSLGYDEDPWTMSQAGSAEPEPLQENRVPEKTGPFSPDRKMQILPVPTF